MVPPRADQTPDCPPPDQLRRMAQGCATVDEESNLVQHLEICEECRGQFEALLTTTDEQDALDRARLEDEQADLSAILAAGVAFPHASQAGEDQNGLAAGLPLDPPREPGFLGSLGDFDVGSVVGEGGMGVVLRAVDRALGRSVAIKLMSSRMADDPRARQRFVQEARAAAQLNHPNIVTIHSVAEYKEIPYFVMEYMAGTSLAQVLATEKRLEPERAVRIASQVLAALEHAHQAGIVHRDVKPANILCEPDASRVKLADFGVARGVADATHLTLAGSVVGTPWYMAPEQVEGNAGPDPRQDLFSLGVVLYEMLAGSLPFPGPTPVQALAQVRYSDPADPIRTNPMIPRALADIVLRALQRDPARRFQSARRFASALEAFLQPARPTNWPARGDSRPGSIPPANELLRKCASCGSPIVTSQTSLGGACEVCHEPLCANCWTALDIRHCRQHRRPEPVAVERSPIPVEVGRVEGAAAPITPPAPGTGAPNRDLSPSQPIPAKMAKSEEPLSDQAPPPDADPEAQAPSGQPAVGSPDIVSLRKQVREEKAPAGAAGRKVVKADAMEVMVETFLRRIANALQSVESVKDPLREVVIPVRNWSKCARRVGGRAGMVSRAPGAPARSPQARASSTLFVVYDLKARNWLGRLTSRIKIEARCLLRSDRLASAGFDDRSVSRFEVETALNEAALRAAREETWHLVILCSPTGWANDAYRFVARTGPDSFHDRFASAILFDSDTGRFLAPHNDEKLSSFRNAFSANDDSTLLDWARLFLRDYLDDNESISHETLSEKLGINRATGIRAMKLLAESGYYNLEFVDGVGWVMST